MNQEISRAMTRYEAEQAVEEYLAALSTGLARVSRIGDARATMIVVALTSILDRAVRLLDRALPPDQRVAS
jgi:hypothetical protein